MVGTRIGAEPTGNTARTQLAEAVTAMVRVGEDRGVAVARLTGSGSYAGETIDAATRRHLVDYGYGRIDGATLGRRLVAIDLAKAASPDPFEVLLVSQSGGVRLEREDGFGNDFVEGLIASGRPSPDRDEDFVTEFLTALVEGRDEMRDRSEDTDFLEGLLHDGD